MARCLICGTRKAAEKLPRARCTGCRAVPRTEVLGLAILRAAPPISGKPVVHISPEPALIQMMRLRYGSTWKPADFDPPRWKNAKLPEVDFIDLTDPLRFYGRESIHGWIHSHVIEHVPAPIDQIFESMNAAVAPSGFHAFIVPGPYPPKYDEDLNQDMPREDRIKRFRHPEHMRMFGRDDWPEMVERHFKGWKRVDLGKLISKSELRDAGIETRVFERLTGKTVHLYIKS